MFGISFDTPEDNLTFATAQEFPFDLLSDVDRSVGTRYGVVRSPDHQYRDYPERHSYLIDPDGMIRRSYSVADVAGHAAAVLADLAQLQEPHG